MSQHQDDIGDLIRDRELRDDFMARRRMEHTDREMGPWDEEDHEPDWAKGLAPMPVEFDRDERGSWGSGAGWHVTGADDEGRVWVRREIA